MQNPLPLGTRVTFTWHLHRRGGEGGWWTRQWRTDRYPGQPEPEPRTGIVVGVRTLSDGITEGGGYDDPTVYRPTRHFSAYLIAFDLRQKPVYVLPEHVRPAPSSRPETSRPTLAVLPLAVSGNPGVGEKPGRYEP